MKTEIHSEPDSLTNDRHTSRNRPNSSHTDSDSEKAINKMIDDRNMDINIPEPRHLTEADVEMILSRIMEMKTTERDSILKSLTTKVAEALDIKVKSIEMEKIMERVSKRVEDIATENDIRNTEKDKSLEKLFNKLDDMEKKVDLLQPYWRHRKI